MTERTNIFTFQDELPDSVALARLLAYVLVLRAGGYMFRSVSDPKFSGSIIDDWQRGFPVMRGENIHE